MKVQMQGQMVRLRVDELELERLLGGGEVVNVTLFHFEGQFQLCLVLAVNPEATSQPSVPGCRIELPIHMVRELASRLPCKEGLSFTVPMGQTAELFLQFDVDVRSSAQMRGKRARQFDA